MKDSKMADRNYRDMTEGNAVKLIIAFAIPLLCGNIFQQIYNVIDTMVAGYFIGDKAIAAIGATASFNMLCIDFTAGCLCTSPVHFS